MNTRMTVMIGGLLLVAATLVGCAGSSSSYNPTSPTQTVAPSPTTGPTVTDVVITIVGMSGSQSYSPNPATVRVGQTVSWRNADNLPHTATADGGAFDTGNLGAGATSSPITMTTAGTFEYHCAIHGFTMTGTLIVTP